MINAAANGNIPLVNQNSLSHSNADNGLLSADFMSNILRAAEEMNSAEAGLMQENIMPVKKDSSGKEIAPDVLEMCMQMNSMFVPDMQIPEVLADTENPEDISADFVGNAEIITAVPEQSGGRLLYSNVNLFSFASEKKHVSESDTEGFDIPEEFMSDTEAGSIDIPVTGDDLQNAMIPEAETKVIADNAEIPEIKENTQDIAKTEKPAVQNAEAPEIKENTQNFVNAEKPVMQNAKAHEIKENTQNPVNAEKPVVQNAETPEIRESIQLVSHEKTVVQNAEIPEIKEDMQNVDTEKPVMQNAEIPEIKEDTQNVNAEKPVMQNAEVPEIEEDTQNVNAEKPVMQNAETPEIKENTQDIAKAEKPDVKNAEVPEIKENMQTANIEKPVVQNAETPEIKENMQDITNAEKPDVKNAEASKIKENTQDITNAEKPDVKNAEVLEIKENTQNVNIEKPVVQNAEIKENTQDITNAEKPDVKNAEAPKIKENTQNITNAEKPVMQNAEIPEIRENIQTANIEKPVVQYAEIPEKQNAEKTENIQNASEPDIAQQNIISYAQAETVNSVSYEEDVRVDSDMMSERKSDVNTAEKSSDSGDEINTANENAPKIKIPVTHSNLGNSHNDSEKNSFGENAQNRESFSSQLMREHRIQSDFRNNINAVKDMMKNRTVNIQENTGNKTQSLELTAKNLDISSLQTFFMPHNHIQILSEIPPVEEVQASEIVQQTFDGIVSHLSNGDEKFTIKLNPEGLGEITVTILKHDDSSILTLSASNSKTAEILSGNMKALQENLKYLNIEIADIEIPAQEEAQSYHGYERRFEQNSSKYKKNDERHHNRDENDDEDTETDYSVEDVLSFG